MNPQTQRMRLVGPAGAIEALRDDPADGRALRGTAVIAHPHPVYGGTMNNKVVQTLARAFVQSGWSAVRFNFRGVGASDGQYDEGRGELQDMHEVIRSVAPEGPLALAGFSFGSYVASHAVADLWERRPAEAIVLVGTASSRFEVAPIPPQAHARTLVIHGEHDDTVPLSSVMDWARPQTLPVTVIPGGEHFFHGQLHLLKSLVVHHLR
jgi:uncharacterized protein